MKSEFIKKRVVCFSKRVLQNKLVLNFNQFGLYINNLGIITNITSYHHPLNCFLIGLRAHDVGRSQYIYSDDIEDRLARILEINTYQCKALIYGLAQIDIGINSEYRDLGYEIRQEIKKG